MDGADLRFDRMQNMGPRLVYALQMRSVKKHLALAVELGVDESALSRWRKSGNMSLANAARLCVTLNLSLDWLVLGRQHMDAHLGDPYYPFSTLDKSQALALESIFEKLRDCARAQAEDQ